MSKSYYPYLNFIRLIATLAIVLLHTSATIYGNPNMFSVDNPNDLYVFAMYKHLMEWAVPAFVLISGALFLSPQKDTSYKVITGRNVKRIFLALLVFALPMTIVESFLANRGESFLFVLYGGIVNWLSGHSWDHMWYLYMLIGLYFITPIVKPFVNAATDKEFAISLFVLFLLSSLLPTLKFDGLSITGYMMITPPYIFIYMLGYYLNTRATNVRILNNRLLWAFVLLIGIVIYTVKIFAGKDFNGYAEPSCIMMAASIFMFAKLSSINSRLANVLSPYCFGVYIIHPFFINLLYKFLSITPLDTLGKTTVILGIPLFFILFASLSLASVYVMMKIPFMKRYVL